MLTTVVVGTCDFHTFQWLGCEKVICHGLNTFVQFVNPLQSKRQVLQNTATRNIWVTLLEAFNLLARPACNVHQKYGVGVLAGIRELCRGRVNIEPLRRVDQTSRFHVVVECLLLLRVLLQEAEYRFSAECVFKQSHFAGFDCELMYAGASHVFYQSTTLTTTQHGFTSARGEFLQEMIPCQNRDRNCKIVSPFSRLIRSFPQPKKKTRVIVLMFLCADGALLYFEVGSGIGRIGLVAGFVTKTDGGKDTHDPD